MNIETKISNRSKSIFSSFGSIITDFYLEAGIFFVGGFNALLVAWDLYTDLVTSNQPQVYAVIVAIIAFVAVEGLAVYLVGAAAKTNHSLLWFFSVVFAAFFTFAHFQEMTSGGDISEYITLAIPFFVVVGYWARTIKVDTESNTAKADLKAEDEALRLRKLADEEIAHKREMERLKLENQQVLKMAKLDKKAPNDTSFDTSTDTNDTKLDRANDTRRLKRKDRLNRIIELAENHSQSEIADILEVSISTIKRDFKQLNGSLSGVQK